MNTLIDRLQRKLGLGSLLDRLEERLSWSELNSLLLELFRRRAIQLSPAQVLQQYTGNRFVAPAGVDTLRLRRTELAWLERARERGFRPLTLSPLAPLGACSAVGEVDQNNVVSAMRGTEVISDATNVLALQIAQDRKAAPDKHARFHYAAGHRHVRGQAFDHPAFTAHFAVFCLASGGRDPGNYAFEREQLEQHLRLILDLLLRHFERHELFLRFYLKRGGRAFRDALEGYPGGVWQQLPVEWQEDPEHAYYDLLQFKVFLRRDDQAIDLADGGPVDWTRRLLSDRKERSFISGIGLELVHKLENP